MASMMTNLIANLFFGFDNLGRGLGGLLSTNATGNQSTNIDYRPWLTSLTNIGTQTLVQTTNSFGQLITNTGGRLNTNFTDFFNNVAGASNEVFQTSMTLSNIYWTNLDAGRSLIEMMATTPNPPDDSDWVMPNCWTNTTHTGLLDLNPRHNAWWAMVNWVKIGFTWMIAIYAIYYIRNQVFECVAIIAGTPGGSPGKGTFSFLTWFLSNSIGYVVLAALPIIAAGVIQSIFGGTTIVSPFSETSAQQAGAAAKGIRMAFDIFQDAFPLVYFIAVVTYLFIFDTTKVAFIVYSTRILMAFRN